MLFLSIGKLDKLENLSTTLRTFPFLSSTKTLVFAATDNREGHLQFLIFFLGSFLESLESDVQLSPHLVS